MTLPIIPKAVFSVKNKWTNDKDIKLYPFTVGQESLFLQLGEGKEVDQDKMFKAIEQVLGECLVDKDIDVLKLPLFLVEYLFVQMRINSISELLEFVHRCDCEHVMKVTVDLREFHIKEGEGFKDTFKITDDIGITLRFPTLSDMRDYTNELDIIISCIDKIFDDEQVWDAAEYSMDEKRTFFNPVPLPVRTEILQEFFIKIPNIHYEQKSECPNCKKEKNFTFSSLSDVFI